jgi:hypothetical protein
MGLRIHASAEVRKGSSMTRTPDLSAFPIPRKGGAKPIASDDVENAAHRLGEGGSPDVSPPTTIPTVEPQPDLAAAPRASTVTKGAPAVPRPERGPQAPRLPAPPPPAYGQTVATTVKLDENRYLRLMEAGKPGPGRLRRRTIQDMLIEALDEWFERRQL